MTCRSCDRALCRAMVRLHDGRMVCDYSDEWRRECEARTVLAMPGRMIRLRFLDSVQASRGPGGVARLCADMLALMPEQHRAKSLEVLAGRLKPLAAKQLRLLVAEKPSVAGSGDLFDK